MLAPHLQARPALLLNSSPAFPSEMAARAWERADPEPKHDIAVVVLTQSNRMTELERAIASVQAQQQVDPQLVLVVNGADPPQVDGPGRVIVLPENVGIPAG